jgi:hypothetical protein
LQIDPSIHPDFCNTGIRHGTQSHEALATAVRVPGCGGRRLRGRSAAASPGLRPALFSGIPSGIESGTILNRNLRGFLNKSEESKPSGNPGNLQEPLGFRQDKTGLSFYNY